MSHDEILIKGMSIRLGGEIQNHEISFLKPAQFYNKTNSSNFKTEMKCPAIPVKFRNSTRPSPPDSETVRPNRVQVKGDVVWSERNSPVHGGRVLAQLRLRHRLHADVVRSTRDQAVEGRLSGGPGVLLVLLDVSLAEDRVLGPDGGLVVGVVAWRERRLPQHQQSCLIPEPHDESSGSIWLCRKVR